MKRNVFFLSCLLVGVILYAQERVGANPLFLKADKVMQINMKKGVTDTLYPPSVTMQCGQSLDSLVVYTLSSTEWIFGCNNYGDTEGAQVFDIGTQSLKIKGTLCWMQKMGQSGNLYAKVYEVNSTTNAPTSLLGTSDAFPNSNLPTSPTVIQMASIIFSTPVTVTGKFAVSIEWICDFPNQSACGLASTRHNCTVDSEKRSWIKESGGSWSSSQIYTDQASGLPLLTDLFILPVTETVSGMNDLAVGGHTLLFPNPANNILNVKTDKDFESYTIYNSIGKIILRDVMSTEIDLECLQNGYYYIIFEGEKENLNRKFSVFR